MKVLLGDEEMFLSCAGIAKRLHLMRYVGKDELCRAGRAM